MGQHVHLDGRHFIVDFDEAGAPLRIKERLLKHPGHAYLSFWHDAPRWHHRHNPIGKPTTLIARIIAKAQE